MRLNEITYDNAVPVEGYGLGFFRAGGQVIEGHALILASGAARWGGLEDLEPILSQADGLDVLLLGMGADIAMPPDALLDRLEAAGVGVEVMSSPSAARAYNVLLSEGRRVGVALLTVDEAP
ncbi:MAG: Mth938-like domain-containing protein [Pseudomonadota bacterium]